jgi:hypothetical protein
MRARSYSLCPSSKIAVGDARVEVQAFPMHRIIKRHMRLWLNLYPPFLGAGIRITRLDRDWKAIDVELRASFWNRNYVGTHYGGSLYSMTDPFYMLMLIENLGRDYIVWDKAASIKFRRATKEKVTAEFRLTDQQLDLVRQTLQQQEKYERTFRVEVRDPAGTVVAEVEKLLYIRKKNPGATGLSSF